MGDFLSNNKSGVDLFGIGLAVNSVFEYMNFKLKITNDNKESLYHVIRKHAITSHPKTKNFMEKMLSRYEKGDLILSMQMLKVIEYMDDELLDIVTSVLEVESNKFRLPSNYVGYYFSNGNIILCSWMTRDDNVIQRLIDNNLAYQEIEQEIDTFIDLEGNRHIRNSENRGMVSTEYTCLKKEFFEIREIYNS